MILIPSLKLHFEHKLLLHCSIDLTSTSKPNSRTEENCKESYVTFRRSSKTRYNYVQVIEYLETIKDYLLSLIQRLEEETRHRKRGSNCRLSHLVLEMVDQSYLVAEVNRNNLVLEVDLNHLVPEDKEGVGSHRTNRGARNQNESEEEDKLDTPSSKRKHLLAGSIRRYQSERLGLTSVEYEEANPINEQTRATRATERPLSVQFWGIHVKS